jgi:hypothetical protein
MRLYLPPRPFSTIRRGGSMSVIVTSAQSNRLKGVGTRKRIPAPTP